MNFWPLILIVITVAAVRIIGIVLRRYAIGSTIIRIIGKLVWLFPIGIFGDVIGSTHLSLFSLFAVLIFLKLPVSTMFQSLYQIVGMVFPRITHKFNLPSKENYMAKSSYILPFTGKWTVVNGGVTKELSHSWSIISQRYAYDFIIVDDEGKSFSRDSRSVHSYYCYGKDIVAPADGEVVKLSNNYKDSFVDGKNAYCDAMNIAGNYIIIKHNDDEYSAVAHIMKGSIAVKVGDKVKQGQIIAKCGNSGNSSEPHIHFQLQSSKSFFLSAGLPIAFSALKADSKTNYELLDKRPCDNNLLVIGDKTYIGRGLEVENGNG